MYRPLFQRLGGAVAAHPRRVIIIWLITGAGLIMAVVFGAFIEAELPVLKMIGVGLCVSVLVDATLVRAFVVPATMAIAGRWNWYPGRPIGASPIDASLIGNGR
jgi:uncharacterized membrane protein YdfJ with MMPL/SSD domain